MSSPACSSAVARQSAARADRAARPDAGAGALRQRLAGGGLPQASGAFPGLHRLAADEQRRGVARRDRSRDQGARRARHPDVHQCRRQAAVARPSSGRCSARMVEHDLPVWVHPMRAAQFSDYASEQASEDEIWFSFGWPYETTACMTRLIYSGLFDELPALKIVSHHMGGMIPYFAGKIKLGFRQIFFGTPERNPVAEEARPEEAAGRVFQDALCRHRARRDRADPLRPCILRHAAVPVRDRCAVRSRAGAGADPQHDRGGQGAGDSAGREGAIFAAMRAKLSIPTSWPAMRAPACAARSLVADPRAAQTL